MRARDVMEEVGILLQDVGAVRWPLPERRIWINAGLREIAIAKPDAVISNRVLALRAGTLQSLPAGGIQLVRVYRNVRGVAGIDTPRQGVSAVTVVPREVMDSQVPDWHDPSAHPPEKAVQHVVYDPEDPKVFYVYPPNDGTGRVEVAMSSIPDEIPRGNPDNKLTGYGADITLDDGYRNALIDYVLYRCYQKDAAFAGNAQRSAAHFAAFAQAVGLRTSVGQASQPNTQNAQEVPVMPASAIR